MTRNLFLISATALVLTALFCTVLMWTMRKNSRPKTVLALISTLLLAYLSFQFVLPDVRHEKLDFFYTLVCIMVAGLIYIYFRLLMEPWKSTLKLVVCLAGSLGGSMLLYMLLAAVCPTPPALYTFGDIVAGLHSPAILLRVITFLGFVATLTVGGIKVLRMYLKHRDAIAAKFSFREGVGLSWIPRLIIIYILYGALTIFDLWISGEVEVCTELAVVNFTYVAFFIAVNLIGLQQQDIYTEDETCRNMSDVALPAGGNGMSVEVRCKLKNNLMRLMETEHEYRNPELRLDNVVKALNTNRTYLSVVIREDCGDNFIGFVNGYRIREAKELLTNSERLPMTEIALRVGFKSISSFNTFFKRETGVSPTQFREKTSL